MLPLHLLAAADTLLVRPVPPVRTGFEQVLFVAAGLAQILMPVVFVLLLLLLFRIWKAQQNLHEQLARLTSKVDPMIASATSATENVRVLTHVVRKDAVRAADAVADVAEAAMNTIALGSRVLRPPHDRPDDRDAERADSRDDEQDDSPYAATPDETPRPARRRRRRGRGRRPPA